MRECPDTRNAAPKPSDPVRARSAPAFPVTAIVRAQCPLTFGLRSILDGGRWSRRVNARRCVRQAQRTITHSPPPLRRGGLGGPADSRAFPKHRRPTCPIWTPRHPGPASTRENVYGPVGMAPAARLAGPCGLVGCGGGPSEPSPPPQRLVRRVGLPSSPNLLHHSPDLRFTSSSVRPSGYFHLSQPLACPASTTAAA